MAVRSRFAPASSLVVAALLVAPVAAFAKASITVAPTTVSAGGTENATVINGPGLSRDWIGLYIKGAPDSAPLDWKYLNGQQTPPATGMKTAIVSFTMPSAQGTYNLRFFRNGTFNRLATSSTITVTTDVVPPVVSGVVVSGITSSAATIAWTTNEASDSQVEYGSTIAYGSSSMLNASLVTAHTATLTSLTDATPYHYRVRSRDASGNLTVSGDFTFTTLAIPDTTPPVISLVTAGSISSSGATISWMTDEASDSQVEYGLTTAYGSTTTLNASPVTAHTATLIGLTDATTCHYRVWSRDAAGNPGVSGDFTFTTLDGAAPSVSITEPSHGATVSNTVSVAAQASDNVGVVGVQFKLDGTPLSAEDTTAPFSVSWSTTTASNGSHVLTATARDAAWNQTTSVAVNVTVANDVTPPAISLVTTSSLTTSAATIVWTTNEASDSQVESGLTTSYGSTTTLNATLVTAHTAILIGLNEATPYHYRVWSRDGAGNPAVSGDFTFTTLDGTAPTVSISAPSAGASVSGTVTVSANSSDNVGVVGVQFMLDGGALGTEDATAPYSISWNTTTASDGSHTLTAVARDAAGNQTPAGAVSVTVANDVTAPVISLVTSSSISASAATITWTTIEASDSEVEYGLTTAYGSTTTLSATLVTAHTQALSGLTDTTLYHYRVKSRDAAGTLATSGDFTFTTLDGAAPSVSISAPSAGATVSGTLSVTATASDNVGVAGVQFKLDGVNLGLEDPVAPHAVSWATRGTPDLIFGVMKVGAFPMTINAGDGFTKRLSLTCPTCTGSEDTVTEDKTQNAPGSTAATFTLSAPARYLAQLAAFKAAGTPAYVQGAANTQQNSGTTTIAQAFGSPVAAGHLIVAAVSWPTNVGMTVTDDQGNVYAVATSAYDSVTNRSLAIVYAANVTGGATTVTASFGTATPTVQRLEIHEYAGIVPANPLDGSATKIADGLAVADGATSGLAVTSVTAAISNGSHTLSAVARDAAGNTTTSSVVTVTVSNGDATPPAVSLTAPTNGATVVGTVAVSATASDAVGVAGVQFKLDGVALGAEDTATPYSVSWSTTTAANGSHTLTAVARDAAGNSAPAASVTVTVANDITAPLTSAVTVSSVQYSTATIVWTTNEASDSQVEYGTTTAYGSVSTLNASLVTAHTVSVSTLTPNTLYHFRVRSRDLAGNSGGSGDFTFTTLEATPPTVSISAPASGATVTGTITVTANASDNVGVVGVQVALDGVPLGAEDTSAPYSVSWNTAAVTLGLHTLTAVARDAAANQTTSLPVSVTVANTTVQVTLAWDANTEPNLAGYKIYYGTASGAYTVTIDVGNITTCTITGLQPGATYYFAATAYDSSAAQSTFSNEVSAVK